MLLLQVNTTKYLSRNCFRFFNFNDPASCRNEVEKINFYIPFPIYALLLTGYFVKVGHDFKEYNSYNHEIFSNVTGIVIDDQIFSH